MKSLLRAIGSVLVGGSALLAVADDCRAQDTPRSPWAGEASSVAAGQSAAGGWRAKRTAQRATPAQATAPSVWPAPARSASFPVGGVPLVAQQPSTPAPSSPVPSAVQPAPQPPAPAASGPDTGLDAFQDLDVGPPPAQPVPQGAVMQPVPMPGHGGAYGPEPGYGPGYPGGSAMAGSCFDGGDACTCGESCGGACAGPGCWGPGDFWGCHHFGWLRDLSLFAGVHGFKGPVDGGQNGNFGVHEGVNWSCPLGDPWGVGFQMGMQAAHSNFQGYPVRVQDLQLAAPTGGVQTDTVVFPNGDRDQVFFTAGLFRRATMGGIQWGVAFDLMHDAYYYTADLKQIRGEISAVWPGWREIGFWGSFGVGNERIQQTVTYQDLNAFITNVNLDYTLEPTDQFNVFYRQYFRSGGEGRLSIGFTNNSDFLFGGDLWIPISTHWAIENSFNVLIPKEGGEMKQREQSWSVMVQAVWYPGRTARASRNNPFRPVFGVADNSVFMVDRKSNQ